MTPEELDALEAALNGKSEEGPTVHDIDCAARAIHALRAETRRLQGLADLWADTVVKANEIKAQLTTCRAWGEDLEKVILEVAESLGSEHMRRDPVKALNELLIRLHGRLRAARATIGRPGKEPTP